MASGQQYWPKRFPAGVPTRTATFSLALSDADESNGCLRVIPKLAPRSSLLHDQRLGPTFPMRQLLASVRSCCARRKGAQQLLPVRRGDITVHDNWVVHGSEAIHLSRFASYVLAFSGERMIARARHRILLYNDDPDVLRRIRRGEL